MKYIYPILLKERFPKNVKHISNAIEMSLRTSDEQRDVRPLMSLLSRLLTLDTRLKRHINRRKTTIFGAEWDILPYFQEDAEKAQKVKWRLEKCISQYYDAFLDAELYGVSLANISWKQSQKFGFVPSVDYRYEPVELEFNPNFFNNIAILEPDNSGRYYRTEIDEALKHSYLSCTMPNSEPGGILVSCVFQEFILNLSYQEWANFIQFVKGIIQGKAEKGASLDDKKAGAEAVRTAVQDKFVFTSEKVGFEFHKLVDENGSKNFSEIQTELKDDIEIAITGTSTLASDRLRNAPTVQEKAEEDFADWSRNAFEQVINEQLLVWDSYMNLEKNYDVDLPYYFKFIPKFTGDREANARMLDMARDWYDVPASEITRLTGIRILEPGSNEPIIAKSMQPYLSPNSQPQLTQGGSNA